MRQYKDIPKKQRNYDYKPKAEKPVVLKDLKGILGELYGDTYTGPYVYVTHKQKYELRVAKRLAKASLADDEAMSTFRLSEQEASIDKIESLDTDA